MATRPFLPVVFAAVLSAVAFAAAVGAAAAQTVHCVPAAAPGCDVVHAAVQDAIDAAAAGDIVRVSGVQTIPGPACFNGAVCIAADKTGLQLLGEPGAAIDVAGVARYGLLVEASGVTIAGLHVRGVSPCCSQGAAILLAGDDATVTGNVLEGPGVSFGARQHFGILAQRCGPLGPLSGTVISGNEAFGWNWGGISVGGPVGCADGGHVEANRVHGSKAHGIAVDRTPGVVVRDNDVTGIIADGDLGAAIAVYGAQAAGTAIDGNRVSAGLQGVLLGSTTLVTLNANRIDGNAIGILVRVEPWLLNRAPLQSADLMQLRTRHDAIDANEAGIVNAAEGALGNGSAPVTTAVVATCDWWGHATGPGHADNGPGSGDVVTDHVVYRPWLRHAPEHGSLGHCRDD
ncbi:MAG: right-handed parallel beta-helix repeat-containing protein [Candidatus Rokubacteria bacterium]|nr:right-handed parallel beta-helix repeat-containing protein [Candidatus Rokubacteria bacterium]